MARHRERRNRLVLASPVLALGAAAAVLYFSGVLDGMGDDSSSARGDSEELDVDWCTQLKVVTAGSYRPVLDEIQPLLGTAGEDICVQLTVEVADGLNALTRVAESGAHVWIPDDASWAGSAGQGELDEDAPGAGTVLATSPIYMVTDESTASTIRDAGASWSGLEELVNDTTPGLGLVMADPVLSGDGMVAAASFGEAVWIEDGMDASAAALSKALSSIRIVEGDALPAESGEVGLVPEYALIKSLSSGDTGTRVRSAEMIAGADNTAVMRYTWLPTGVDGDDPQVAAAMAHVFGLLTGSEAAGGRSLAGLRGPGMEPVTVSEDTFPAVEAEPFEVFSGHAVDHVFATFFAEYRRTAVHLAVDVSGSMAAVAPGSQASVMELVIDGLDDLVGSLPDDAEVGLWRFGSQLAPPDDWVELVPLGPLDSAQRGDLATAITGLVPTDAGTGLYDTMLDVYLHAQEQYRDDIPSHAIVITDGVNEDRPGSLTTDELVAELEAVYDPDRPVELTVIAVGDEPDTEALATVLEPVDSYLTSITTADEIAAAFIHLAAHGVDHQH